MMQNKFVLGLTGSIGSGKSYASTFFEKKGCAVLDADKIAKSLYEKGSKLLEEVASTFGRDVLQADGSLNKERLSEIVFSDKEKLASLNNLLKVELKKKMDKLIDDISFEDAKPFIVLEAPVLFEYGFEKYVDYILLITADEDLIIKRVMERNQVSEEEVRARLNSQISQEEKKKRSDMCIDNSSSFDDFEKKLEEAFKVIR